MILYWRNPPFLHWIPYPYCQRKRPHYHFNYHFILWMYTLIPCGPIVLNNISAIAPYINSPISPLKSFPLLLFPLLHLMPLPMLPYGHCPLHHCLEHLPLAMHSNFHLMDLLIVSYWVDRTIFLCAKCLLDTSERVHGVVLKVLHHLLNSHNSRSYWVYMYAYLAFP